MNWLTGENLCYKFWGDAGSGYEPDIQFLAKYPPIEQMSNNAQCKVFYGLFAELEISLMQQCATWEPSIMIYDKKAVL